MVSYKVTISLESVVVAGPCATILLSDFTLGHAGLDVGHGKSQVVAFSRGGLFSLFPRPIDAALLLATIVAGLLVGTTSRFPVGLGRETAESCEPTVRGEEAVALEMGSSGFATLKLEDDVGGPPCERVLRCWDRRRSRGVVEGEYPSACLSICCDS